MDGTEIRVAVAHGLGNTHQLMDLIRQEPDRYHFVEIMACPGGCVGGGGQPQCGTSAEAMDANCLSDRAESLYDSDRKNTIRRSHENPEIQKLYQEFLDRPLSERSHELLHTHYHARIPKGIVSKNLKLGKKKSKS
jgi:iron only hydrogenase large subunit-like protein